MDTNFNVGDKFIVMKKFNNATKDHDKDRALILEVTEVDLTYVMFDQPQYTLKSSNELIFHSGVMNETELQKFVAEGKYMEDYKFEVIPQ